MIKVTGVLLAAGASTRFGSDKLLTKIINQNPMLKISAMSLKKVIPEIVAVIGSDQPKRAECLNELGITVRIFKQADLGMGNSLAYGIKCCAESDAWIIALADMPYIKADTLSKIYQHLLAGATLTAPYYQNHRGHPVGFAKSLQTELTMLNGDKGAKHLFDKYHRQIVKINTDDKGILRDIDRPFEME